MTTLDAIISETLSGTSIELLEEAELLGESMVSESFAECDEYVQELESEYLHDRFAQAFSEGNGVSFYARPNGHIKLVDVNMVQYLVDARRMDLVPFFDPKMGSKELATLLDLLTPEQEAMIDDAFAYASDCSVEEVRTKTGQLSRMLFKMRSGIND